MRMTDLLSGKMFIVLERLVYSEDDWLAVRRDLFMVRKDRFTVRTGLLCGEIRLWCWRDWFTVWTTGLLCGKTDL